MADNNGIPLNSHFTTGMDKPVKQTVNRNTSAMAASMRQTMADNNLDDDWVRKNLLNNNSIDPNTPHARLVSGMIDDYNNTQKMLREQALQGYTSSFYSNANASDTSLSDFGGFNFSDSTAVQKQQEEMRRQLEELRNQRQAMEEAYNLQSTLYDAQANALSGTVVKPQAPN